MASSVYAKYRTAFVEGLAQALKVPPAEVEPQVKIAEPAHGDLSFATFALAKAQKKAPPAIATELAGGLRLPGIEVSSAGPYVNARFLAHPFGKEVIDAA